jgi:hypothetical protein
MAATSAERVLYAAKSRKWNSTQNNKFATEFSTEHAANLEWVRKTEEEAVRKRAEEEAKGGAGQQEQPKKEQQVAKRKREGSGKWWIIGVVGIIVVMRAWQRYKEVTFQ